MSDLERNVYRAERRDVDNRGDEERDARKKYSSTDERGWTDYTYRCNSKFNVNCGHEILELITSQRIERKISKIKGFQKNLNHRLTSTK